MFHTLGGWVHRRRRLVLLAWAVLFAVGIVVGSAVFSNLKDYNGGSSSPSVPGAEVKVGGELAVSRDQMAATQSDLVKGELIALPILLLALFFVFRGWRSALMPVISALVTVAGALLILLGVTQVMDVASYAIDVVALFGIALAVDYSLLIVNRFREERAADPAGDLEI